MKKIICLLFAGSLCLTGFGKDDELEGKINGVNEMSGENKRGEDIEILKINTIQSGTTFEGVMRISMQLEGKDGKVAWGIAEQIQRVGEVKSGEHEGTRATGAVVWTCEAGNKDLKRQKLKAYTVEYGYMKGGEFVVLDSEYDKVDSFDEIEEQNKNSLPLKMKLSYLYYVN
jgi:hypothetical protein